MWYILITILLFLCFFVWIIYFFGSYIINQFNINQNKYNILQDKYIKLIEDKSKEVWPLSPPVDIPPILYKDTNIAMSSTNSDIVPLEDSPIWDNPQKMKEKLSNINQLHAEISKKGSK